jgi:hypothetical protein
LLDQMAKAGFFHVFIGIETPDPKLLKTTQKMQNVPGNPLKKLERIRQHGIHVTAGFIVGFDGEDKGVFEAQTKFIRASGIGIAMVGLLQAIPHTQLSRRLKDENRLLEQLAVVGNLTVEGINFIPKGKITKREYLENYSRLVRAVFDPASYFTRILPAMLNLNPKYPFGVAWRDRFKVSTVLLKELWYFKNSARFHFIKALLKILTKNPAALEAFTFDSSIFHHLHRHSIYVQQLVSQYLLSPLPGDVLDRSLELEPAATPLDRKDVAA